MRRAIALAAAAVFAVSAYSKPKLVTAAIYDYTPDGQLKSVLTPTSDTAAVKTTYKKTYIGGGKVRVSVYRKTLENPSFAKFDYDESKAVYDVASLSNVARGDSPGRLVSSYVARAGRKLVETDALGNKTVYKYNRKGRLAEVASPNGVAAYKYDKRGRLAATVDPLGRVTKRLYDRDGRLAGTVNPLGGRTIVKFDKFGRRIARRGAGTYPLTFKYNSFGQMTSYTDDNGNTTSFQYDKHGRLATRVWPDGSTIRYSYDKRKGLLTKKVEANRVTKYKYDDMNRLTTITTTQKSKVAATNLTYSKTGQLLSIATEEKSLTTDVTDTTDKKLNGTPSRSFSASPKTSDSLDSSHSSSPIRSIRTIRGQKVLIPSSQVFYSYDKFNRVTLEKSDNGTVSYEYNAKGLLASKKVSVGTSTFTTTYVYDDLDRLTTIDSPAGKFAYRYDKQGRVKSQTMGAAKVKFTYDEVGRLTAKTLLTNGKKTIIAAYKYDKLNRRVAATVLDTAWKYKYDKRNQLIGAVGKELTTKNTNDTKKEVFKYGFDPIGNRLSYSTALTKETYDYNKLNQILNDPYKYDAFGNLVRTPDATYKYNLNNRLVEIKFKSSTTDVTDATDKKSIAGSAVRKQRGIRPIRDIRGSKLTFSYDGNGRRTEKKVYDKSGKLVSHTKFLYSGFKCVAELDALSGKVAKFYQWNNEQLLGVVDVASGKQLACLTDGNKNVVGLIDNSGAITACYTYSPFGKLLSAKGADTASCSFGFSSEYRDDESGLVYYNYRYLNPKLGRWMTRDLVGEELGGYNLYAFVSNIPPAQQDFLGLMSGSFGPHPTGEIITRYWADQFGAAWLSPLSNNKCNCSCNSDASKEAGHPVYEISCSLSATYQITLANAESPVWINDPAPSYPSLPAPSNWNTLSYTQKRNFIIQHERKHVAAFQAWYNSRKQLIENAEATYYSKSMCDEKSSSIVADNESTATKVYQDETNHVGW